MYYVYFNNIKIRKRSLASKNLKFLNKDFSSLYIKEDILDDILEIKSVKKLQDTELFYSISHLLRYEDRNSMAHSIEARVPFLDYEFVQKASDLPIDYKIRNGWTKAPLRKYMEDKMPKEVAYRKNKLGFAVPQEKWLNELNDYFIGELLENPKSSRFFNIDIINDIFHNKSNTIMRFKFIIVEMWMRIYNIK